MIKIDFIYAQLNIEYFIKLYYTHTSHTFMQYKIYFITQYFINFVISDFLEIPSATYVCRNLFLMSAISHKIAIRAISGYLAIPYAFATGRGGKRIAWTDGRTNIQTNSHTISLYVHHRFIERWPTAWSEEANWVESNNATGAYICRFVLKTVLLSPTDPTYRCKGWESPHAGYRH